VVNVIFYSNPNTFSIPSELPSSSLNPNRSGFSAVNVTISYISPYVKRRDESIKSNPNTFSITSKLPSSSLLLNRDGFYMVNVPMSYIRHYAKRCNESIIFISERYHISIELSPIFW